MTTSLKCVKLATSIDAEEGAVENLAVFAARSRRAFTLVELLVVISIIGMLTALLLPAVQQAREAGRSNTCRNNLRNCTLAVLSFESVRRQYPGYREPIEVVLPGDSNPSLIPVSWVVTVLPYLERKDAYALWRNPQAAVGAGMAWPPQIYIDVLNCPSSPPQSTITTPCAYVVNSGMDDWYPTTPGMTSFATPADFQANGIFFNHFYQPVGASVAPFTSFPCVAPIIHTNQDYVSSNDGSSNTFLATENNNVPTFAPPGTPPSGLSGGPCSWGDPATAAYEKQSCFIFRPEKNPDPALRINGPEATPTSSLYYYYFLHPASAHPGGVNVSFCDGHVRYLTDSIDYDVYCLLMTPNGAQCNTPSTIGGLDGAGGTPTFPSSWWYTTNNYAYLRVAPLNDARLP